MKKQKQEFTVITSKNAEELENQLNVLCAENRIGIISNIVHDAAIVTIVAVYPH